ncbi:MAG: FtsX-like permease family protein, partial [Myxococcota bacterium]
DTRFSYEGFIAARHLMAKKRTSFLSVITVISVLAVAVGVWCLTVVLSVMSGFESDLRGKILGTHAHAVVLKYATAFEEHESVAEDVREVRGVKGVSPFLLGQVMVTTEGQVEGVVIKGIVPETVGEVTELANDVEHGDLEHLSAPELVRSLPRVLPGEKEGSGILTPRSEEVVQERSDGAPPLPGIAIGRELSRKLRVFVGDRINVISPLSEEMGPTGPIPRSRSFRVAAVFYTGMYEYDASFVYIHLDEAQRFFDMPGAVTGLEVRTGNLDEAHAVARRIETRLEGYPYYSKHWGEMHRNLFAALKLEKLVMAVILAFIVLVASFVILATLIMMVMEKGKDIAILKSMGARDSSIMKIFVLEGLVVAVIGTILGLALGLGTCMFIASGLIKLNPEVYYIHTLPVQVEPLQLVLVCIVAVLLSYLATVYPSVTASRLHPVEGLRDE